MTNVTENENDVFDVHEAALFLKCAASTLYSYVSRKKIPHIKMGARLLFRKQDLLSWLDTLKKEVGA